MDNARLIDTSMQAMAKELGPQPYVELEPQKHQLTVQ